MKKQIFLILFALLLAAVYVVFFTDLTSRKEIQIKYGNIRAQANNAPPGVFFQLNPPSRLASIKVVSVSEAATNKTPHLLWHLVSKKPATVNSFAYGHAISGMTPFLPNAKPEPLQQNEKYHLIVEDVNKVRGEINFDAP